MEDTNGQTEENLVKGGSEEPSKNTQTFSKEDFEKQVEKAVSDKMAEKGRVEAEAKKAEDKKKEDEELVKKGEYKKLLEEKEAELEKLKATDASNKTELEKFRAAEKVKEEKAEKDFEKKMKEFEEKNPEKAAEAVALMENVTNFKAKLKIFDLMSGKQKKTFKSPIVGEKQGIPEKETDFMKKLRKNKE